MTRYSIQAAVALCAMFVACCAVNAQDRTLKYAGENNRPILSLTREHGMMRGLKDEPLVRVFAGGRVHVHIPAYMKNAGHYEYELDGKALDELLATLDGFGLFEFDMQSARSQVAAARTARQSVTGERFVTLDSTRTRIELAFASWSRGKDAGTALIRTIEWPDPAVDAGRYPEADAVVGLAAAEKTLLALLTHPSRRAIKAPAEQ